jgi:hypothetical protein
MLITDLVVKSALPTVLISTLFVGCAQTRAVSREEVVQNLDPIVKVEQRGQKLVSVMQQLPLVMEVDAENAKKLKEHYDVYHVYHNAATISLAQGNFQVYNEQLGVASKELDSIEHTLKTVIERHPRFGRVQ